MFLYSNIIGTIFLLTEAWLAYFAFASLDNFCDSKTDLHFPCKTSGLYNLNFLDLPGIGQICNFYPMLNIAAVPILNITLRNNLLDVLPIKHYIKKRGCCLFLLDDHKRMVKGAWSCILSIPVFCIVFFYRDVQTLVTYTGGLCGSFILLIFPASLVYMARKKDCELRYNEKNHNKTTFGTPFVIIALVWAAMTIISVIIKVATGTGGGE